MTTATRRPPAAPPLTPVGREQAEDLLPRIKHAARTLEALADDIARAARHRLPARDIEHLAPVAEDVKTSAGVIGRHYQTLLQLVRESAPAAEKGGVA